MNGIYLDSVSSPLKIERKMRYRKSHAFPHLAGRKTHAVSQCAEMHGYSFPQRASRHGYSFPHIAGKHGKEKAWHFLGKARPSLKRMGGILHSRSNHITLILSPYVILPGMEPLAFLPLLLVKWPYFLAWQTIFGTTPRVSCGVVCI